MRQALGYQIVLLFFIIRRRQIFDQSQSKPNVKVYYFLKSMSNLFDILFLLNNFQITPKQLKILLKQSNLLADKTHLIILLPLTIHTHCLF